MTPYRTPAPPPPSPRWGATFWARLYARAYWPFLRVLAVLGLLPMAEYRSLVCARLRRRAWASSRLTETNQ